MSRRHAFVLSLAIGLIVVFGVFAAARTVGLGNRARAATDAQVARRAAALDRYAASLRTALAQKSPALPALPAGSAAGVQPAPVRIVYHRPPPIVIHKHRPGGEAERSDGGGFDD
jgi:hypothetical protein